MFLSTIGSPVLVIVLALMLWISTRNLIKQRLARTKDTSNQSNNQQAEIQITIMLLMQSILAIVNYAPFGVYMYILYYMFTDGDLNKTPLRIAWEGVIIAFIRLSSYLFAADTFYLSMILNYSFRQQFNNSIGMRHPIQPTGRSKS